MTPEKTQSERLQASSSEQISQLRTVAGKPLEITVFKGDPDRPTKAEWILIAITLVLAVFNYFTVRYAADQAQAALDAAAYAKESANSSDTSLAIAKLSIALAEASLETTRNSALVYEYLTKADLRAYVSTSRINPVEIRSNMPLKTAYEVVNVGKTPARNLLIYHLFALGTEVPEDLARTLKESIDRRDQQGFILGSNVPMSKDVVSEWLISKDDSIAVYNGTRAIFLLVLIRYYDTFNQRHYTWQCVSFSPASNSVGAYKKFNDAD